MRDGRLLLVLGIALFVLCGLALAVSGGRPNSDFRFVYNGVRCLIRGVDAYKYEEFVRVYEADGGQFGTGQQRVRHLEMAHHMYLPSSAVILPLGFLPWSWAEIAWWGLTAGSLIAGCVLIWRVSAQYAPVLAGGSLAIALATSWVLLILGNVAGLVVGLCLVAAWSFIEGQLIWLGICCLAFGLMLKPHDAGLIWLFFLVAGRSYRRYAIQTAAVSAAASLPLFLWATAISPHWPTELRENLGAISVPGGLNDFSARSMAGHGLERVIELPAAISALTGDASFVSALSYTVCGAVCLIWVAMLVMKPATRRTSWFALAACAALTMLPVYHRMYDAKLLILTIPAFSILWREGGATAWVALTLNALLLTFAGDIQWTLTVGLIDRLPFMPVSISTHPEWQMIPIPLLLLLVALFYIWAYLRRAPTLHCGKQADKNAYVNG